MKWLLKITSLPVQFKILKILNDLHMTGRITHEEYLLYKDRIGFPRLKIKNVPEKYQNSLCNACNSTGYIHSNGDSTGSICVDCMERIDKQDTGI